MGVFGAFRLGSNLYGEFVTIDASGGAADDSVPIVCTAGREEITARIEQMERMRSYLDRLERTPHGVMLHFPIRPDIDADLRRFVVDEKHCCAFWDFEIRTHDDELTLSWDGPPGVGDFFGQLVALFAGDEPLAAISGLL